MDLFNFQFLSRLVKQKKSFAKHKLVINFHFYIQKFSTITNFHLDFVLLDKEQIKSKINKICLTILRTIRQTGNVPRFWWA